MSEKFKPGEVVFHKLNGERMLVSAVFDARDGNGKKKRGNRLVKCEWQDGKLKFRDRVFQPTSLTHEEPRKAT